jgi:hypothetical protein
MDFLVMSRLSLILLGFFVAGGLRLGFGHELSGLGLAIPASALVVDTALGVDPDLAAGLSGGDLGGVAAVAAVDLVVVFLGAAMLPDEAGATGAAGAALELAGAAGFAVGAAAAGALRAGAALAAAALDFLLLFLPVDAAGAAVSAAAVFEALSAAAFLLFCNLFVVAAVLSLAAALSAAAAFSSAAAFSFLAFFLAFLAAAVSELVSLELACAFAKAGEMATVNVR